MKTALLIPAYEPDEKLLVLLENFRNDDRFVPIVVNDGSVRPVAIETFKKLPDFAVLLVHEVNRGKGAALKTGIEYVMKNCPDCDMILTADADGQHTPKDIARVNERARANPNALVLGSRKFEGDVPFRSRTGNAITRAVYAFASGVKVYDTQTGLRAFSRKAFEPFTKIDGDRYEYEINMLLEAARNRMPILEEWIETVYLNDNESSHFNPLKDSMRIYKCILRHFVRFGLSSLLAFVLDYVLVLAFNAMMLAFGMGQVTALTGSKIGARVISSIVNFTVNRKLVFKADETLGRSVIKYIILAVCIFAGNYAITYALDIVLGWPLAVAEIISQIIMFFVSYAAQRSIVYRKKGA